MPQITPARFTATFPSLSLGLQPDELDALLAALCPEELSAGETLIVERTDTASVWLVWDGQLTVAAGRDCIEIARVGRGAILGEVSLVDPGPASATVRCDSGATVLVLERERLEQLWAEQPAVAAKFLRHLSRQVAQRIRTTTVQLNQLAAFGGSADATRLQSQLLAAQGQVA